ncbi:lipopolysaccharide biosynthesis protein [Flavobacterium sp. KACC 22763]|uniref:lipopolysaccharide biosynthesis protein n=1 Tax=Flavobacterium sp. KACC 22763 TaxID=3025668 RepID=UPI002365EF4E|nr:MATE family efflux transporter [Flavobacterium sp. KACC 22763]WDF62506.1 MATE family efflux transporter [Flavobacterium sp. KACC 22763]
MKHLVQKIYDKAGIKSNRTKNITRHVFISFLYKGGSIICSFLMVPLTIKFLDTDNYGVWLTLSSFIAWFSFFDIGIGNGLRNKFAEAKAKEDLILAKTYVSTAYFTIGSICFILIPVFFLFNFFVDWSKVFNTNENFQKQLSLLMPIVFALFCLNLVGKLITTIYTADQNHSMQGKINFYTSLLSLIAIWFMIQTTESSLFLFGIIFSVLPVLILIGLNVFAFTNVYKDYKPVFSLWKKDYFKDIFGLGFSFFFIQMAWIIITTTDNIIISQLFSPKEVVPYNLALKLFSISIMMFTIIVTPYWSSFTEAYFKSDYMWIKVAMKNLKMFIVIFCVISVMILLCSDFLYKIWLGKEADVPFYMSLSMCIYTCLIIYLTPFNYFINGIGKVKLQLYQTIFMSVLNIPISIFFAKHLNIGPVGIILGTIICIVPSVIISTVQFNKIISQKAKGIWNL